MSTSPIQLTPAAVQNIHNMLKESEMEGYGLRFGIRGGGCSGYSYILEFSEAPEEGDSVHSVESIPIYIASLKRDYIQGTTIDFVDELLETGFKINNPQAKRECGCGESFDLDE